MTHPLSDDQDRVAVFKYAEHPVDAIRFEDDTEDGYVIHQQDTPGSGDGKIGSFMGFTLFESIAKLFSVAPYVLQEILILSQDISDHLNKDDELTDEQLSEHMQHLSNILGMIGKDAVKNLMGGHKSGQASNGAKTESDVIEFPD